MTQSIKKEIQNLKKKIKDHDYRYYVLSDPKISDKEYDDLIKKLVSLEEKYPQYKTEDSPTSRVSGGILDGFKTVTHKEKMLSLENTYSFEELGDWDKRARKGLGNDSLEYVTELKIDGLSANLTYDRGKLIIGATRGDGASGEDVTQNIKTIRAIPLALGNNNIPDFIEIRGEVFMDKKEFEALNKEKQKSREDLFANPRNAASGSLKLLDTSIVAKRRLKFFAHSLGAYKGQEILTQWEFLQKLKTWGLYVNPESKLCSSLKEVLHYCRQWEDKRDRLEYEIDGVVIKINSLKQQKRLGFTMKSPRWAIAYKFPARQATTQVLKIQVNVGRTGVITPVAELKPVECGGVIIKHATLHNFDEIKRLGVKEKDIVLIERAGDVIPKVVKVTENKRGKPFEIPQKCPVCSAKIIKEKEEDVAYRCINPSCPAQLKRAILHFASRQAMDIQGLGESVVNQLVESKLVSNFADIYSLKKEDLLKLDLFKDKKAQNLVRGIKESKERPLSRLIFALGIRNIGEKAAFVLANHFKSLDKLQTAKKEDFDAIYEIGPVMAESIVDFFAQPQTKKLIENLRKKGINFIQSSLSSGGKLEGKSLVFTGELKDFTRVQAQSAARNAGGNVSSSLSKNTDFLVAGDNPGSKYDKAKKLGVKIIGEREFLNLIGGHS